MGRKRSRHHTRDRVQGAGMASNKKAGNAPDSGLGPVPGMYPTASGEVELRIDPYTPGAFEVYVNGVPSSHINVDPLELSYEYMRWIAQAVSLYVDDHLDPTTLRITHLGGGACSLPRYMVARFPRSRNTVVEIDDTLATLARTWFDLPKAPAMKIRAGDARKVTDTFVPGSRDVIIRDVFAGSITPDSLTTVEFYAQCHKALSPQGLYIANCGDHKELRLARNELAGMQEVFAHVAVIADPPMLKGRRYGNIILLGCGVEPFGTDSVAQLGRSLLGGGVPAQYHGLEWTRKWASSGHGMHDSQE